MLRFFTITTIAELACLISALVFLIGDKRAFWKRIILYIFLAVFTEIFGKVLGRIYHNNIPIYNLFILIELSFITYGFYVFLRKYIDIKLWMVCIYAACLCIYFGYFLIYGINSYNAFTVSVMSVVFVIYGLMYFYLLLKDENYIDLKFHPAFWWVGGAVIFYFGGTLANFFDSLFQSIYFGKYPIRYFIYSLLNVFLYGFWTYSFICRARQRKLTH